MRPGVPAGWSRISGPVFILLAAALAIAPQFFRGNSCGHDFDFHLISWLDAQTSWRLGIPYPHWTPSANFGAGEPRFVFYPPLTWMLGAALGFVLPWQLVPIALTFLLLAATGLATRALARQVLSDGAATLAGCVAIFSGYALFCAYERSAFGELAGGFWIPLVLLLILQPRRQRPVCGDPGLRDRTPPGSLVRRALDGSTAPLALVVAGAWLSNAPVGVMISYLLAAVALAAALLSKSWAPVVRAAFAAALGMGLASVFLVPAAWEQPWADLKQAASDPGERIENSWLFARHADPALDFHDFVLHQASIIAVLMVAVALGGLLVSWRRKGMQAERRWWIPLALIPFAVLFLQFPISLPVWNLLPKLRFLQFPWRWLVVLEAPMALFFAAAVWPAASARRWRRVAVAAACATVFLAVTATAGLVFFQPCDEGDAVAGMLARYRSGVGLGGTDEYEPPGADDSLLAFGLPAACLVTDPSTVLGKTTGEPDAVAVWQATQASCEATFDASPVRVKNHAEHFEVRADTVHAGYLVLRLRSYPAWRVLVNERPIAALPQRDDGLMAVPVPKGPVDLTVDWTATRDAIAGRWLSGLSLLLVTALCLLERRFQRPSKPRLS
jgi:hypothetical protein